MKTENLILILSLWITSAALAAEPVSVTHEQFQAVQADGTSSFVQDGPARVILQGIVLNSPERWYDPTADDTPAPWQMGGQWEMYIQGEADDHAGTALWMGQNYGNGPGYENYTNQQWLDEICRINHDPNTAYIFTPGDRVRLTGRYLFYKGKLNINENHEIGDDFDFKIELIEPAVGLPQPEVVRLSQLKDADNNDIFDPNRLSGCEYYQSRRIRINGVGIIDPANWGPGKTITIQDSDGLTFPVRLGVGAGLSRYDCPTGRVDVIGILDQSAPGYPPNIDNTKGYRLLVLDYDGNGMVLTHRDHRRGNLPGDINGDFKVDIGDIAEMAANWLQSRDGLWGCSN